MKTREENVAIVAIIKDLYNLIGQWYLPSFTIAVRLVKKVSSMPL